MDIWTFPCTPCGPGLSWAASLPTLEGSCGRSFAVLLQGRAKLAKEDVATVAVRPRCRYPAARRQIPHCHSGQRGRPPGEVVRRYTAPPSPAPHRRPDGRKDRYRPLEAVKVVHRLALRPHLQNVGRTFHPRTGAQRRADDPSRHLQAAGFRRRRPAPVTGPGAQRFPRRRSRLQAGGSPLAPAVRTARVGALSSDRPGHRRPHKKSGDRQTAVLPGRSDRFLPIGHAETRMPRRRPVCGGGRT
jgi:hypothetical protein